METIPKYREIMDYIQEQIQNHVYQQNAKLPTEQELSEQFDVCLLYTSAADDLLEAGKVVQLLHRATVGVVHGQRAIQRNGDIRSPAGRHGGQQHAAIHQPDIDADFLLRGEAVVDDGLDGLRLIPPGAEPEGDGLGIAALGALADGVIIHEEGDEERF